MNRASFVAVLALTVSIAAAAFLLVAPVVHLLIPAREIGGGFFPDQHQRAETLLFLLAFVVELPVSVLLVPRLADRIAAGPNGDGLEVLAAALTASLLGAVVFVKASERLPWNGGLVVLAVTMAAWCLLAALVLGRAAGGAPVPLLQRAAGSAPALWALVSGLLLVIVLGLAILGSIDSLPLALAIVVAAVALLLYLRLPLRSMSGRWGFAADAVVAGLVFVSVPNLVVIQAENPAEQFETQILHFHQDFLLGPAAQILGGGTMLVDTVSQYGVGSIYMIAGWLGITAPTNGMVGLIEGLLTASMFVGGYAVLRLAGVSRSLSAGALAVSLIVLVWGLVYPIGGLLQHGAIRFGLPMGVLVAAVAEARVGGRARLAVIVSLLFVGISSIWALEAFAYTLVTAAGTIAALAWLRPPGERRAWVTNRTALIVATCVVTHVVFALTTLVATGELPDWGLYLTTLHAFLAGDIGDLTYDFSPWSPGLALGALYLASGVALLLLIRRRSDYARDHREPLVAIAGSTAYGIALFSYLVNRSADHIVPYVGLPAVIAVVVWLSLLLRAPDAFGLRLRASALAIVLAVSALMIGISWSSAGDHLVQSAIAYVPPGGRSLPAAIDRLQSFPPISAGATDAEALLERDMPGEQRSLIIVDPDLGVEALARTGRVSELPMSDPWEDSLVPQIHVDDIAETVAELSGGRRILLDSGALERFADYRRSPSVDPLSPDSSDQTIVPSGLAPLQEYALKRIARRFRLQVIDRAGSGLVVAELVAKPANGASGS